MRSGPFPFTLAYTGGRASFFPLFLLAESMSLIAGYEDVGLRNSVVTFTAIRVGFLYVPEVWFTLITPVSLHICFTNTSTSH